MSFRIGDTLVYLDSNVTTQERSVLTPGKQNLNSQLVICNPKIAACQRKCGLDPRTDTTVFGNAGFNIIPFGEAKFCDIFDSCSTFESCISAEKGIPITTGSNFIFNQNVADYGTYLSPSPGTVSDTGGSALTFNNTSIHYSLTAGIANISDSRYNTNYLKRLVMDFSPASCPHTFTSGGTSGSSGTVCNIMVII